MNLCECGNNYIAIDNPFCCSDCELELMKSFEEFMEKEDNGDA